jgi:hypothetical protein
MPLSEAKLMPLWCIYDEPATGIDISRAALIAAPYQALHHERPRALATLRRLFWGHMKWCHRERGGLRDINYAGHYAHPMPARPPPLLFLLPCCYLPFWRRLIPITNSLPPARHETYTDSLATRLWQNLYFFHTHVTISKACNDSRKSRKTKQKSLIPNTPAWAASLLLIWKRIWD